MLEGILSEILLFIEVLGFEQFCCFRHPFRKVLFRRS